MPKPHRWSEHERRWSRRSSCVRASPHSAHPAEFERCGVRCAQPKLQSCVPFTPVTGARVLVRDAAMRGALTKVAAQTLTKITGASSLLGCEPTILNLHWLLVVLCLQA